MTFYPSRKKRTRKQQFKRKKMHLFILTNLFIVYAILITTSYITSDTYSYFADNTQLTGTIKTMDNFCEDKEYKKNHKELCQKCKDNSGLGNGSEPCDEENYDWGDGDNPGNQDEYCPEGNCNDHNNGNGSDNKEDKEQQKTSGEKDKELEKINNDEVKDEPIENKEQVENEQDDHEETEEVNTQDKQEEEDEEIQEENKDEDEIDESAGEKQENPENP